MSGYEGQHGATRGWRIGSAALLTIACVLAYAGSLHYPFIFDDLGSITGNPYIRSLWPPVYLVEMPAMSSIERRPIVSVTLALNYAISGNDPWSYRALNLIIHIGCALLLIPVVERILRRIPGIWTHPGGAFHAAWLIAMLWAVHPLNSEVVVYVIQRTESLFALCLLGMLVCLARGAETTGRRRQMWLAAAVGLCVVGMGCKETMVVAPLLALLYDRFALSAGWRDIVRSRGVFHLLNAVCGWGVLAWLLATGVRAHAGFGLDVSPLQWLYTQAGVIVWYLRLAFWPYPLAITHDWPIAEGMAPAIAPGMVVLALLGVTVASLARSRTLGFAGAWFFLILAPTSSIVPIVTEVVAERRMYMPLVAVIGVVVVVAVKVLALLPARWARPSGIAAVLLAVAGLLVVSIHRVDDYRTELNIWQDTVRKQPGSKMAHHGLADAYRAAGDRDRYVEHLRLAAERGPEDVVIAMQLGTELVQRGEVEEGLRHLNRAASLDPTRVPILLNRGAALAQLGRTDEAMRDFEQVLTLDPRNVEARVNIAVTLARRGDLDAAETLVREALAIDPDHRLAQGLLRQIEAAMQEPR